MEIVSNNLIIVPCDFSPKSYYALEYAAFMARSMSHRILLLHVTSKETNVAAMEDKLRFLADECFDKFAVLPEIMVRVGRPYITIRDVATELNPTVVILKTGRVSGVAHYTGIRTIKILSGTVIPFMVVQKSPKGSGPRKIVFPINFLRVHNTKLKQLLFFSQYYPDSVIYIITPSGKNTLKEKNVAGSIKVMTKALEDQGVHVNFITHDKKKNIAEDIIRISHKIDADLIMIQMEQVPTITKFLFGLREEKLITNAYQIPVMCMHRLSEFNDT